MKMIMPIARPATVSVSQVDDEPTKGRQQRQHGTSASGTSRSGFGSLGGASRRVSSDVMAVLIRS